MRQETPSRPAWSRPAAALSAIATLVIVSMAALSLQRAGSDRSFLTTGRAQWIWYSSRVPKPVPLRFYAVRQIDLAAAPATATARVFVDREHVLYVNGRRVGGATQRPGDPLAEYEVGPLLRPGLNRIVIAASSPTGIGGILFALDAGGQALVSDGRWRVDRDPATMTGQGRYRPEVWGMPPMYPWGYPRPRSSG